MVDLHIHTTHSDGFQTVSELLQMAEQQKLQYISFTDHMTVDAYKELKDPNIRKLFSGTIIPGVEIEFIYQDVKNELIGYGIDIDKIRKHKFLSEKYKLNRYKTYRADLYNLFTRLGFHLRPISEIEREAIETGERFFTIIKRDLRKGEINKDVRIKTFGEPDNYITHKTFWLNEIYQPTGKYHIPLETPTMEEASKTIRDAGGLVFMAHVFRTPQDKSIEILEYATKNKLIDGIEVYYNDLTHSFTDEQVAFLEDYCKKHNLLISGGSDNHGRNGEALSHLPKERITLIQHLKKKE